MNPLRDPNRIDELLKLRAEDPEAFMKMTVEVLKKFPDIALTDIAPPKQKKEALDRLLKYLEKIEDYEDCAFIVDLKKKIADASKE